jgi:hypothetical protein
LEKKYNESVSKKSALHEAFEATKMELKDSYVRYTELQKEVDGLRNADGEVKGSGVNRSVVGGTKPVNGVNGVNGAVVAAQAAMDSHKTPGVSVEEMKAEQTVS